MTLLSMKKIQNNQQKNLPELLSDYCKVAGYRVNRQKLIAFHTSNEQVEFEISNTTPFTLASPKMKYLDINLTKYVQGLSKESSKL